MPNIAVTRGGDLLRHARLSRVVMVTLTICVIASLFATPTLAHWGRPLSFGASQLNNPFGVAVDQSNGDLYVSNLLFVGNDKFDSSHNLLPPSPFAPFIGGNSGLYSGIAVDPINHDAYVVDGENQAIDTYDPTNGKLLSSFSVSGSGNFFGFTAVQIATDAAGNVYFPNALSNEIQVFDPSGAAPSGIAATITGGSGANALSAPTGVAVDSSGDIWVADNGNNRIEEFDSSGAFLTQIASPGVQDVAVDSAGNVFALVHDGSGTHVLEYDSAGTQIEDFGTGTIGTSGYSEYGVIATLAVDNAHGWVYVADAGNKVVWVFVQFGVTTGSPTNATATQATLNGIVEPEGTPITSCEFEYGTTASYGHTVPCSQALPYANTTDVSANVSGLTGGTTYHFRLVAANANGGSNQGEDRLFGSPVVSKQSAEADVTSAKLTAQINPLGNDTTCHVQYVDEAGFQSSGYANATMLPCAHEDLGSGSTEVGASAALSDLEIDTLYHFRFLATNVSGTTSGPDQTFATFGIKSFSFGVFGQGNQPYTQAGGHPYQLTVNLQFNTSTDEWGKGETADANPKDTRTELPAGLIGNPDATPKCAPYNVAHAECRGASQVGMLTIYADRSPAGVTAPLYNLVPPSGLAAQLGARFSGFVTAHIDAKVRTGGDYGITSDSLEISAGEGVTGATVTLWGVPADPSHNGERYCPGEKAKTKEEPPCPSDDQPVPFLRDPTSCSGHPLLTTMLVDAWQEPGDFARASSEMPGMTGCEKLYFSPTISVQPQSTTTDSATGLHVDLHIPQNQSPTALAEADLKDAVVAMPAGVTVNPAAASGLVGCSPAQIELNGPEPAKCPDASKIGTVEVETPLIEHVLKGSIYVADQNENPFDSLLAIYIAIDDEQTGTVIKLAGKVTLDPQTGQLTTTFNENPQLPFEELRLDFFAGPRAALATPQACGTYTATALMTPWSAPQSGPAASLASQFAMSSEPGGKACGTPGFAPSFTAGTLSNQAGGFSPFTLTLARQDGEQRLSSVAVKMPPGLAGILANVALCGEAQANAGQCPAASQIGHVTAIAGVGEDPVTLPQAGKPRDPVYLTGPYEGAPFGLSVAVPAEAGPFNLDEDGGPVVVRARVEVDPHTSQITVTSDPFPQMVNNSGIPTDLRMINVETDRSNFMFDPTNCNTMSVGGTVTSATGSVANVSSPFRAANCATLPFHPSFKASTQAKHSRKDGASLHVVVQSGRGQANIGSVVVDLPKLLPSRLSTLKLACTEKVFAANPALCPAGSRVGIATAHTPVLPVPLVGPAYFVSHGGAKFPELVVVLQGYGITIDLAGETFISSKSVTRSTFRTVPDVPVTRFDLTLPAGPDSALAATGNLCTNELVMPTTIKGQNGAVIKQSTKVAVSGCPKTKKATKKAAEKGGKGRRK